MKIVIFYWSNPRFPNKHSGPTVYIPLSARHHVSSFYSSDYSHVLISFIKLEFPRYFEDKSSKIDRMDWGQK